MTGQVETAGEANAAPVAPAGTIAGHIAATPMQ